MRVQIFIFLALCMFFEVCCAKTDNNSSNVNENNPQSYNVIEIRKQKPVISKSAFPYGVGFNELTFIKVVTNSPRRQKAQMVYYDFDDRKWKIELLGEGIGEGNSKIGEFKFNGRWGFGSSYWEDPPEYYLQYLDEDGITWRDYKIENTKINCITPKNDPRKNWSVHLLVSYPLNPESGLPDVVIILQWIKDQPIRSDKADLTDNPKLKELCSTIEGISYN